MARTPAAAASADVHAVAAAVLAALAALTVLNALVRRAPAGALWLPCELWLHALGFIRRGWFPPASDESPDATALVGRAAAAARRQ